MGNMLAQPITRKESECRAAGGKLQLSWASSCMQGWRLGMEDDHICMQELLGSGNWRELALFGVMDGHGGEQVAKFAKRNLARELCECPLSSPPSTEEISQALTTAFHRIDELLRDPLVYRTLRALTNEPVPEAVRQMGRQSRLLYNADTVGCTCCMCCITEDHLIVANAGDSRAVLCRGGRAVALSEDHKPNMPRERQRIAAAGGYIEETPSSDGSQYRVNGNLNLSRALGDLEYKRDIGRGPEAQIISGTPDVQIVPRTDEDEFVVICCDGVWDVRTNQQVVDFIREGLPPAGEATDPDADAGVMMRLLEDLLDACISKDLHATRGLGSDNMTAVVVRLPPPASRVPAPLPGDGLRVDHIELEAPNGSGLGRLHLRVALPAYCTTKDDMELLVREQAAELRVIVSHNGRTNASSASEGGQEITLDLMPHLPTGAQLCFGEGGGQAVTAKFRRRRHSLCAWLPWRL